MPAMPPPWAMPAPWQPPVRPSLKLAKAAGWLGISSAALGLVVTAVQFALWGRHAPDPLEMLPLLPLTLLGTGLSIATIVVFCIWLYRVLDTARMRSPGAGVQPGWAIGSFFIPFAHLVLPYPLVRKGWRAFGPPGEATLGAWFWTWSASTAVVYVGSIWSAWLGITEGFAAGVADRAPDVVYPPALTVFLVLQPVLGLAAGLLLLRMATAWSRHQEQAAPPPGHMPPPSAPQPGLRMPDSR